MNDATTPNARPSTASLLRRVSAMVLAAVLATPVASHLWNQMENTHAPPTLWSWWVEGLAYTPTAPLDVATSGTPLVLAALVALLAMQLRAARERRPRHDETLTAAPTRSGKAATTAATAKPTANTTPVFGDDATRVGRPAALEDDPAVNDDPHADDTNPGSPAHVSHEAPSADDETDAADPDSTTREDSTDGPFNAPTRREPLRDVPATAVSPVAEEPEESEASTSEPAEPPFADATRRVRPDETPFGAPTRQANADSYDVVQGLSGLDDSDADDS